MPSTISANLDQITRLGSSLLRLCHGRVDVLVATVGSARLAPHIYRDVVRHWFGIVNIFPEVVPLLCVVAPDAPVCVARGWDLAAELAYGNHPSIVPHVADVHKKICSDVVHGLALVLDLPRVTDVLGLRLSPLAVVLKPKFRIIHDLAFARAGGRSSVNGDIDLSSAPCCELGHVLRDVLLRVSFFRHTHGPRARIVLCRVDV